MKTQILPDQFPVYPYLQELCDTLKNSPSRCMILTAETGAGKSTVFPLGLLENFSGKILMTEPRRLSAVGTSNRISALLGEETGETCGYRIHLESKTSAKTRLEVVTEAVLVRMLQEDFALEKYSIVVLDEFHERSCSLDLAAGFLKEALSVRDDLFVVAMSATIDAKKISAFFGDAPVFHVPGRTFPVEVEYKNGASAESSVLEELNSGSEGNILVFQPGIREIRETVSRIEEKLGGHPEIEILTLHSSIGISEQKKILAPSEEGKRRIIVSSAIAETSLTVPGITCVIDSGLSRTKIFDPSTGMEKLVTVKESEFSAAQRTGRAGRTQKGKCIRLWSKSDIRQKEILPELLRSDLSPVILEWAERGTTDADSIPFIDRPSSALWNEGVFLLRQTGMIDADGNITAKGRCAVSLPADIRISGVMISSFDNRSAENFARQILFRNPQYSDSPAELKEKIWNDIITRIEKSGWKNSSFPKDNRLLLLDGYTDRLAKKISEPGASKTEYQMTSGRKAFVHSSAKINSEWIVATEIDAGTTSAIIFSAEEISGPEFEQWLSEHSEKETACRFDNGSIKKEENICLGKIILQTRRLKAEIADMIPAWKNEICKNGIKALPLDDKCTGFLMRAEFYRQQKNENRNLEAELSENFDQWLAPFLGGIQKLDAKTVLDSLRWYFDGNEIDREVPEAVEFSNGRKIKVAYEKNEDIRPVCQVIIQRIFGCFTTPKIMGKRILLKLLSPANRPLQITEDLENFWTTSWPEICKEMKGRYPKHNWDYRIAEKD